MEQQRTALASFAPHVAGLLSSPGGEALLAGHRREISALFCDMRGFTAFAETAEPEELFSVLREYHAEVGRIALDNGGTVEHFAGDGFMIFFNDPTPVADHPLAATRAALAMHERFAELAEGWRRRGYDLGLGIGISVGYATLGRIGFEGPLRLRRRWRRHEPCRPPQLSGGGRRDAHLSQRLFAMVEDRVVGEPVEELSLKGFSHLVTAYRVTGLREAPPELGDGSQESRPAGRDSRQGTRPARASGARPRPGTRQPDQSARTTGAVAAAPGPRYPAPRSPPRSRSRGRAPR